MMSITSLPARMNAAPRFCAEQPAPKPAEAPTGRPLESQPASEEQSLSEPKQRLLKRGRSLAIKLISNIPGFSWVSLLEKLDPPTLKSKLKNAAIWGGVYLAGASIPAYSGYQWYSHASAIGKLRQHHHETGALINQFTSAPISAPAPAQSYYAKAISMVGLGSTPESLQKSLLNALPDGKRPEAQQILDALSSIEKPSEADYQKTLHQFIRLINRDNALDAKNQAELERALSEAFEQNSRQFEFPAFRAPENLDNARHRYMMICLLGTLAIGTLYAGRTGYQFAKAKIELAQSIRETVQDATTVLNEYRNTSPTKPPDPPKDTPGV